MQRFGQSEELTTRLQNILKDYPGDETILKELLQNADDAKATKMYVILDKRTHGGNRVFSETWKELQGPALLVWNDAIFKESDFVGIQTVGFGSKHASDPETIGQYGIGFNVVYHLTDCPSFISNGKTMCIFDPHCRYVPGASSDKPGGRIELDAKFWQRYPDLKTAYLLEGLENLEEMKGGTLFRLPLRQNEQMVRASKLLPPYPKPRVYDGKIMEEELERWTPCIIKSMLFLNSVKDIKMLVIEDGRYGTTCAVKHHFSIGEPSRSFVRPSHPLYCQLKIVTNSRSLTEETLTKEGQAIKMQHHGDWLIQQGIGDVHNEMQLWPFEGQMKPKHGIALRLDASGSPLDGQVYCFLPLPTMSHLPVHINGQFVLDTARRGLWQPASSQSVDLKDEWNRNLLSAIASSYFTLLTVGRQCILQHIEYRDQAQLRNDIKLYYSLFANPSDLHGCWKMLALELYNKIAQHNADVLAVIKRKRSYLHPSPFKIARGGQLSLSLSWHPLRASDPQKQAYFYHDHALKNLSHDSSPLLPSGDDNQECILEMIGMVLTVAPVSVKSYLDLDGGTWKLPIVSPLSVYEFFAQFCDQILPEVGGCPLPVEDSKFRSIQNFKTFCRYVLEPTKDRDGHLQFVGAASTEEDSSEVQLPSFPEDLHLLLTADKCIRKFQQEHLVLASEFSSLFPSRLNKFLHPDLLDLKLAPWYFVTAKPDPNQCYEEHVHSLLMEVLPKEMMTIDKAEITIMNREILQNLWNCFQRDPVFSSCLETMLSKWALLPSTTKLLFSSQSPVLPLYDGGDRDQGTDGNQSIISNAVVVLCNLKLPFLEQWVPEAAHSFCPQMIEPSKVLQNLVNFHMSCPLVLTEKYAEVLLAYFKSINFKQDTHCIQLIRSLPFYHTIGGELVSCDDNECTHTCPQGHVFVNADVCFKHNKATLLDYQGMWRNYIQPSEINIEELSAEEVYNKYIFNSFHLLDKTQRYRHLEYIRDELDHQCRRVTNVHTEKHSKNCNLKQCKMAAMFVENLKILKCIGANSTTLESISDFCDPTIKIFKLSECSFNFLPTDFLKDERWLKFFRLAGLKVHVTEQEFCLLARKVMSGECNESTEGPSEILVRYLLENKVSDSFLRIAIELPFVKTKDLSHLTWITDACKPKHVLSKNGKKINMTSLSGSYLEDREQLIWTVKPVLDLPLQYTYSTWDVQRLGVSTSPTFDEVLQNIIAISRSHLSNEELVDIDKKYPCGATDLISIIKNAFEFFIRVQGVKKMQQKLSVLRDESCIPVQHSSLAVTMVKPHLVIASEEAKDYYPFLHCLPHSLYDFLLHPILSSIGVRKNVGAEQLCSVLSQAHTRSKGNPLDENTMEIVQLALKALYTLLMDAEINLPSPLYLPDFNRCMRQSTDLVYCDNLQYSHKLLEISSAGIHIFYTTPQSSLKFCSLLSENIRPKPISTIVKKTHQWNPTTEPIPLVVQLEHTLQMPELVQAMVKVAQHLAGNNIHPNISQQIGDILSHIKVTTVQSLTQSLRIMRTCQDIGKIKLKFETIEEEGHCHLLVNSSREAQLSTLTCKLVCEGLAEWIVNYLAEKKIIRHLERLITLKRCFSMLLMAQRSEDLQEVLKALNLKLDITELSFRDVEPVLGEPIPHIWHHRLDQTPDNLFRHQEWVGYEADNDDVIVFAQIAHPVPDPQSASPVARYRVYISEDDATGIVVSSLQLYKFLHRGLRSNDATAEQRPASEATLPIKQGVMMAHEIKLKLHQQLRDAWKLPDMGRLTSMRRYFLMWHPEKNKERVELAKEVHRYIQEQIGSLEKGEEPGHEGIGFESDGDGPPPSWQAYFAEWDRTAHEHSLSQEMEERMCENQGRRQFDDYQWQPYPDHQEGVRWMEQAVVDWNALRILSQSSAPRTVSSHICFVAYEVMRKAVRGGLIAACGVWKVGRGTKENVEHQALALEAEVPRLKGKVVQHVEVLARYEGAMCGPQSGEITVDHAQDAERRACAVLEIRTVFCKQDTAL